MFDAFSHNRVAEQNVDRLAALSDGFVPLATSLAAEFIHYPIALLVCWFNILLPGWTLN